MLDVKLVEAILPHMKRGKVAGLDELTIEHLVNRHPVLVVNVCLLDLSKAFDKMDHSVVYLKLMDRSIPVLILSVLENWCSLCLSCVKW